MRQEFDRRMLEDASDPLQTIGDLCANPQAWLIWVLARIADHKITRLDELMPWRYADQAA